MRLLEEVHAAWSEPSLSTLTARATHARPLHPAALASVPYGLVFVRVRVRVPWPRSGRSPLRRLPWWRKSCRRCPLPHPRRVSCALQDGTFFVLVSFLIRAPSRRRGDHRPASTARVEEAALGELERPAGLGPTKRRQTEKSWLLFEGVDTSLYDLMRKSKSKSKSKKSKSSPV